MNKCKNCSDPIPLDHAQVGGVHMKCEQEYFHDKNVRMIKARPLGDNGTWLLQTPEELSLMLNNSCIDEEFEIKQVKLSKGDIEALPEFDGF